MPHSVEEFVVALSTSLPHCQNLDDQPFYLGSVTVDERVHVVFGSVAVMEAISDGRELELHMDAAMKYVPGLFKQLFVMHVVGGGDNVSTYPFFLCHIPEEARENIEKRSMSFVTRFSVEETLFERQVGGRNDVDSIS